MNRSKARRARTVIVLGVSGSGKDTQASFLLKYLPKARRISTGDGLRRMAARKGLVGVYTRSLLHKGGLFPAWAPIHLWLSEIIEKMKGDESFIFTSGPRRLEEAKLLDAFLGDLGRPLPVAFYLKIPWAVARERLKARGRHDDTESAIRNRIAFFRHFVLPVANYYRRSGRLVEIDGNRPIPKVWADVKGNFE